MRRCVRRYDRAWLSEIRAGPAALHEGGVFRWRRRLCEHGRDRAAPEREREPFLLRASAPGTPAAAAACHMLFSALAHRCHCHRPPPPAIGHVGTSQRQSTQRSRRPLLRKQRRQEAALATSGGRAATWLPALGAWLGSAAVVAPAVAGVAAAGPIRCNVKGGGGNRGEGVRAALPVTPARAPLRANTQLQWRILSRPRRTSHRTSLKQLQCIAPARCLGLSCGVLTVADR